MSSSSQLADERIPDGDDDGKDAGDDNNYEDDDDNEDDDDQDYHDEFASPSLDHGQIDLYRHQTISQCTIACEMFFSNLLAAHANWLTAKHERGDQATRAERERNI